ncbi:beta-glucanase [Kutzneria sp. 744]|nr:beta-glucanase [Kutzneria sp. 744]
MCQGGSMRAALLATMAAVLAATTCTGPQQAVSAAPAGRHLIADEEFDGTSLDLNRWNPYNSKSTNGISTWSASQLKVAGGELQIIGQGKDPTGKANRSGALCWCKGDGNRAYGLFGIRAKLDPGKGYAPAFLLWPESNVWPRDGETDIIETVHPQRAWDLASIHWGDPPNGDRESGKVFGDFAGWHVYWVDWRPDYVKIYVDRTIVYDSTKSTKKAVIPNKPMHMVMQQEPGPYAPKVWLPAPDQSTPDKVVVHVDWVRMYD